MGELSLPLSNISNFDPFTDLNLFHLNEIIAISNREEYELHPNILRNLYPYPNPQEFVLRVIFKSNRSKLREAPMYISVSY